MRIMMYEHPAHAPRGAGAKHSFRRPGGANTYRWRMVAVNVPDGSVLEADGCGVVSLRAPGEHDLLDSEEVAA